jgi:hypothetical protein
VLVHRTWLFEFNEDWGGFAAGEFLLRDDGVLFIRHISGSADSQFSPWTEDPRWHGMSVEAFTDWARAFQYQMSEPSRRIERTASDAAE